MKVVTAGIIKNDLAEVLIVRRGNNESLQGFWEFPGGKKENDESEEECIKRELSEELAIDVEVGEFVGESHYVYEHGEFLLKAYWVNSYSGEIVLSVHDDLNWTPLTELKNYKLAPADIPIAEKLIF